MQQILAKFTLFTAMQDISAAIEFPSIESTYRFPLPNNAEVIFKASLIANVNRVRSYSIPYYTEW